MYVHVRERVCVCCVCVSWDQRKWYSSSSVAGREQINPHRARMLPHSLRHGRMAVCVFVLMCLCVYFRNRQDK